MMLKALSQQSTMRSEERCEEWERLTYDPVRAQKQIGHREHFTSLTCVGGQNDLHLIER